MRLLLALLLTAPATAQFTPTPHFPPLNSPNFALLRQSWIEDLESKRLASELRRYAPVATLLNPDGTHADGIGQIRDLYTSVFARFDAHVQLTTRNNGLSGDLAYDSGSWQEDLTDRGTQATTHAAGDYLVLYHRDGLGPWLILQQAFTQAPAAR